MLLFFVSSRFQRLERQLNQHGKALRIFELEHRVRSEKVTLELFKRTDEIRERDQHWWEKIGALRVAHYSMFVLAIIWFTLILASLIVKFQTI